jgi:AcrR family transcriptional regulator
MGIEDRRQRERALRRASILDAAWEVAEERGYSGFSLERVAARAEIGRATIYSYFDSLDDILAEMSRIALCELEDALSHADGIVAVLDVPVRLAQRKRSHFDLLFPQSKDPRAHMNSRELQETQTRARDLIGRVERIAKSQGSALPADARARAAFLAGVSMAGATVPELQNSTTLRHQWQHFCLGDDSN